jgi:GT2 family glycosyltransferase
MRKYVIVVTKGRPVETRILLDLLAQQEARPDAVFVVGVSEADLPDVAAHPLLVSTQVKLMVSATAGCTAQRNVALDALLDEAPDEHSGERWFVSFFDDDFRPHRAWLKQCDALFSEHPEVIGMTGCVLADGVKRGGLSEADALRYLAGELAPEEHWASGPTRREVGCAYGCNMAFVDRVIRHRRFDEALPLYGWQEDYDFTARARSHGPVFYEPSCVGVHLGVGNGRVSGVRFGYSQIANPFYLARKHTMARKHAFRFICRNVLSNCYNSVRRNERFDYRGRLRGNVLAFFDMVRGIIHPRRILDL